ncbi:MAG: PssD/Cps14F family polysaccharide biosynthesis glycosyltransferase [Bryobacteraceae bacterium]
MKVCIVSSCGGHLTEVRELLRIYEKYEHFYVINKRIAVPADMEGRVYFIRHSERDWKFFLNLWEAWRILRKERADVLISTGAGPAVPFTLVGRALFGMKVIFIETFTRVNRPSVTGRIMYRLAHRFFYQSETLRPYFPKGEFGGTLL